MKVHFTAVCAILANDRIGAYKMANGIALDLEKRTGQRVILTITDDANNERSEPHPEGRRAEAGPGEARHGGPHPGDDFAEDGGEAGPGEAGHGADGLQRPEAGDGAEPAMRGRGRPRKSDAERDGGRPEEFFF